MENEIQPLDEGGVMVTVTTNKLKIYSERAIWGFSFVFTTVFGGVLLMQDLRDIGRKKEGNLVLIFSIVYTAISIYIVNIPEHPKTSLTNLCNLVGGVIMTKYFFNKYFPNQADYDKRKIWKPLIISIVIMIPFLLAMIYSLDK